MTYTSLLDIIIYFPWKLIAITKFYLTGDITCIHKFITFSVFLFHSILCWISNRLNSIRKKSQKRSKTPKIFYLEFFMHNSMFSKLRFQNMIEAYFSN